MTFHRLFPPTSFFPSRLTRPPSLSLPPCEFPGQLQCSVPGMSAYMAALPECILRQPACFSMGIEARYDSQIRYLTKRATHKSGAEAWEECVDSSQREPDRPLSFHLVNRLLFQRYFLFQRNKHFPTPKSSWVFTGKVTKESVAITNWWHKLSWLIYGSCLLRWHDMSGFNPISHQSYFVQTQYLFKSFSWSFFWLGLHTKWGYAENKTVQCTRALITKAVVLSRCDRKSQSW